MARFTYFPAVLVVAALVALALASSPEAGALAQDCAHAILTIDSCKVNTEMVKVMFRADTVTPAEELRYTLTPSLGTELYYGATKSPGLKNVSLRLSGTNEYTLMATSPGVEISEVHIFDSRCTGENYVSSRSECAATGQEDFFSEGSVCSDYPSIQDRVRCRLYNVEPATVDVPEECRILAGTERTACISHHVELEPCLAEENDTAALECAEALIGLGDINASRLECDRLVAGSRPGCIEPLREKVYRMTRFKFQLLGSKARSLLWEGVTEENIVTFISNLEVRTQAFNSVDTVTEKINIVTQVQQLWDEFLFNAEPQVLSNREGECATC